MSWWKKVSKWLGMITVRNRDARGRYVADDPSTPDKDEAYTKVYKTAKGAFKKPKAKKKKLPSKEDLKKEFNTDRMLDTAKGPIKLSPKQKAAVKYNTKKKNTK